MRLSLNHLGIVTSWSRIFAIGLVAGALAWWPLVARAADDSAPDRDSPADWERLNQVLEIPQACAKKGVVVPCKDFSQKSKRNPEASGVEDDDDADAGSSASADGGQGANANPATIDADDGDGINSAWGTLDDYEREAETVGPAYPIYGPALAPSAYVLRPGPSTLRAPILSPTAPPTNFRPGGPWMLPPMTDARPAGAPMAMPAFPIR